MGDGLVMLGTDESPDSPRFSLTPPQVQEVEEHCVTAGGDASPGSP